MTKKSEKRLEMVKDFLAWLPAHLEIVETCEKFPDDWSVVDGVRLDLLIRDWADGTPHMSSSSQQILESLRVYRDLHGRNWKAALQALWDSGLDTGHLRQARALVGRRGLKALKL